MNHTFTKNGTKISFAKTEIMLDTAIFGPAGKSLLEEKRQSRADSATPSLRRPPRVAARIGSGTTAFLKLGKGCVTCVTGLMNGFSFRSDLVCDDDSISLTGGFPVKNHFPLLDGLRFAAALGVAVFHQIFWSWAWVSIGYPGFERQVAADVLFPSSAPYTWFGWVGVEIFFVISGFVIANSASNSSPTEFLLGRALRLYPAVWVCATATFLVLLLFGRGPASQFIVPYIHAMTLVPKGVTAEWLDGVYWTLAVEMAFYGLVFCAMHTKTITLRHLAIGLTIYSAVFNAFALLVLSWATPNDWSYLAILAFRVPLGSFLLNHGCFFALGIWLFISANRKLTAIEQLAVAVACLSGAAEIYCFASFFLTCIPAIADQSALVPIMVWAAAVLFIAVAANRSRRSAGIASRPAPAFLRTLGLITYPLYLTHNVIGTEIIRVLVNAGLDATSAVWLAIGILVLVCWFICAKIEPSIRGAMRQAISYFGQLPERKPAPSRPTPSPGLRLPLPIPGKG